MGDTPLWCCFFPGVDDAPAQQWKLCNSFSLSLSSFCVQGDLAQRHRSKNWKIQREISWFFGQIRLLSSCIWLGEHRGRTWIVYLTETHFLAVFILSWKGRAQQQQNLKWWEDIQCSVFCTLKLPPLIKPKSIIDRQVYSGTGAQERLGVRSFVVCGCINCVLNKKDLIV